MDDVGSPPDVNQFIYGQCTSALVSPGRSGMISGGSIVIPTNPRRSATRGHRVERRGTCWNQSKMLHRDRQEVSLWFLLIQV